MTTLEELRSQRQREDVAYHRARLERFAYELETKLETFRIAAEELGNDSSETFDMALQHLSVAAGEIEFALKSVRRAREALA